MDTKIFEAPVLEPTTQEFIDALASQGGKPIYQLSTADAREVLEGLQREPVQKLPAHEEDITIPGGLNDKRFQYGSFFHGGGWMHNPRFHDVEPSCFNPCSTCRHRSGKQYARPCHGNGIPNAPFCVTLCGPAFRKQFQSEVQNE